MGSVAKYLLMLCLNQSINTFPISQKLSDLFTMYFNYLVLKLTITVKSLDAPTFFIIHIL